MANRSPRTLCRSIGSSNERGPRCPSGDDTQARVVEFARARRTEGASWQEIAGERWAAPRRRWVPASSSPPMRPTTPSNEASYRSMAQTRIAKNRTATRAMRRGRLSPRGGPVLRCGCREQDPNRAPT